MKGEKITEIEFLLIVAQFSLAMEFETFKAFSNQGKGKSRYSV